MGKSTPAMKTCKQCGGCYASSGYKYCSDACREKAHRKQKTVKQREYNEQRIAETGQSYYQVNREQVLAKAKDRYSRWRAANPLPARAPAIPAGRHGGPGEWARMYEEHDGLCCLCLRPLPEDRASVHVDHDHTCCDPGPRGRNTRSCQNCRRGLTHERCNQIWGLAREDADLLRIMAAQGERVRDETRLRIANKPYVQDVLI